MENCRTRVLVVTSNADESLAICDLLSNGLSDFETETVSTYGCALAALKKRVHDVCLLDYRIDGYRGLALLRGAIQDDCRMPIILIAEDERRPADVEAVKAGAADCLLRDQLATRSLCHSIRCAIERSRALNTIRESESKFRILTEQSLAGIYIVKGGKVVFANGLICEIMGYSREEILSWGAEEFIEIVHPSDRAFVLEQSRRKQAGVAEIVPRYDLRVISKTGETKWLSLHSKSIPYEGGNAVQAVVLDITKRKLAETALNESEERYRTLVEQATDMICTIDLKTGAITNANAFAARTLGYDFNALLDRVNFLDVVHPEDHERTLMRLRELSLEDKRVPNFPLRIKKADGEYLDVEVNGAVLTDASGNPATFVGVIRDVTERKKTEDALRESEARYRLLAENASDLIWTTDMNLRFTYVSPSVTRLRGHTVEEALAQGLDEILAPDSIAVAMEAFAEELDVEGAGRKDPKQSRTLELEHTRKDGSTIWAEVTMTFLRDTSGRPTGILGVTRDISDRKQAEEALRESELQHRTTLDSMGDAIHVVGRDLRIVLANTTLKEWSRSLGLDPEPIGKTIREVFPFLPSTVYDEYQKVLENGATLITEEMNVVGDATIVTETRKIPVFESGKAARIVTVIRDITERKRAEQALKESEERYRTLVDNSLTGIYLRTGDKISFVNKRLAEIVGYSEDELLNMSLFDIVHSDDRLFARERAQRRMSGRDNAIHGQYRIITKTGGTKWVEAFGSLISYQGKPAVLGNIYDITEAKRAEELLRQSEEKFRTLFEESKDVVYITTPEGRLVDINSAGVELFGYSSKEEILRINVARDLYVNPEDRKTYQEIVARQGYVKDYELLFKRKDGNPVTIMLTANAVRDASGAIVAYRGIMRDVTERKQLEEQLFQAQKMESIGTLAGGIAHDFNNLLGGILGYASFMKTKADKSHPFYNYIDTIERSAMRAAELTSQLLAFARGGKYNSRPVDLNAIATETLGIIGRTFDKEIEIETHFHSPLPSVEADAGQMQQFLMNLCVNARDAMPCGGKLIVETDIATLSPDYVKAHVEAKAVPYVTLSVTDTGMGISKENIKRIFEPFFTTKEKGKGTGLGLAMVYGVVKNHGGFIRVYSELGIGTTFKVYLPASDKLEIKQSLKTEMPRRGNELILVVDDEEPIRSLAKDIFENYGYRVLLAEDGAEAAEMYGRHKEEINLVILDMVMPKMGGRDTFLKLKELNPSVKALLSTGYSQNGRAQEILNSGVLGFIQKPYNANELLSKVRGILDAKG